MHISRVVVRNYRNLAKLDLRTNSGTTCIVGENNTGKTNLLSAVRLAIDVNLGFQHRSLSASDFSVGVDHRSPQQVLVSLELRDYAGKENEEAMVAAWAIADGIARITYRFRPKRSVIEMIKGGTRERDSLTIEDYRWEIVGAGGEVDPSTVEWDVSFGKSVRLEDLQQFLVVHLPPIRDVERSLGQTRYSPLAKLMDSAEIPEAEKAKLIQILDEANSKISDSATIKAIGANINEAFAKAAGSTFSMSVDLGMSSSTFGDISRNLNVLLSNKWLKKFDPGINGLGLNNVLFVCMILRYFEDRAAEGKTPGQLLVFEEPEAHLHPQLQRVLFQAIAKKPFQTLLTTHSSHITSCTPLNSIVVLTDDGSAYSASSVPALTAGFAPQELSDLERYLDATRGVLLFAKKVMLVEGPAEMFLIPPLIRALKGIDLEERGISVIPIFGIHFWVYAKLFGAAAIAKRCAIVADGDLEPSDANEDFEGDIDELDKPDFSPSRLRDLESDFVKVFKCRTTFERELTSTGNLSMLNAACVEIGARKVAEKLTRLLSDAPKPAAVEQARGMVLAIAKRFGKARFAQVCSKHAHLAHDLPQYIGKALAWLA